MERCVRELRTDPYTLWSKNGSFLTESFKKKRGWRFWTTVYYA